MRWRQRQPGQLLAACRNIAGRRREIVVVATEDHRVALLFPPGAVAVLDPLQAGRLRGALRDVVLALDDPGTAGDQQHAIPTVRADG